MTNQALEQIRQTRIRYSQKFLLGFQHNFEEEQNLLTEIKESYARLFTAIDVVRK